jgi:hypothetical protein
MVVHIKEAEAGGSGVRGQPGLHIESLFQKEKKQKKCSKRNWKRIKSFRNEKYSH